MALSAHWAFREVIQIHCTNPLTPGPAMRDRLATADRQGALTFGFRSKPSYSVFHRVKSSNRANSSESKSLAYVFFL